jgi:hypothetical protein
MFPKNGATIWPQDQANDNEDGKRKMQDAPFPSCAAPAQTPVRLIFIFNLRSSFA